MSTASDRLGALMLALASACGSHPKPSGGPAVGRAIVAALAAADHARAPWRCAAADTPALPDDQLGSWKLGGHALRRDGAAGDVAIGVIADAGGSAPPTIAALGRLRAHFDQAHVDLVVSLGGMGASEPELEATLGTLADRASYPVVAIPAIEPAAAQAAAVAALRKRGDLVADGRLVRWIELSAAAIATIPGAGSPARLVAGGDGCGWRDADLQAIYGELAARPGLRIAASAEAPRERDSGELALVGSGLDVHLHGPTTVAPSPGRDGSRDGKAIALTPGTSDATTRLPDAHHPSAGVLSIHGGSWTWRPLVDSTR